MPNPPRSQQTIASANTGRQHVAVRTKRLSDRRDMHAKCTLLDKDAPPDPLRQVVLGDELALCLNQFRENLKGTAPQRNGLSRRAQFPSDKINLPFRASVDGTLACLSHHRDSPKRFHHFRPSLPPTL